MTSFDTQRFLETVLSAWPGPVSYINRDLKYLYANQAYGDWFGISQDQCLKSSLVDVVGEAGLAAVRPQLDEAFAGTAQIFERLVPYRTGPRHVRIQFIPDNDGSVLIPGIIAMVSDSAEQARRTLANQLAESQNYLRLVLDSSQHGIWGLNTRGEVTFINRRGVELLGYEAEDELLGRPMHALVHHHHADGRAHALEDCPMYDSFRHNRSHHVLDDVLWRKDQTAFPISYHSTPVTVGGVCMGSVVTFEDITTQKNMAVQIEVERAKSVRNAKLASLGELSAGVAHEINNPLAIIAASADVLSGLTENPVAQRKIEAIKKSSARISRIVKGLEKFSRSGSKPNYQTYGIMRLVTESLILIEPKSKRDATEVTVVGESSATILCDEVEIEQVIINLVNNAIDAVKSLPERWVRVTVADSGPEVVLWVDDSGPGISDAIRDRMFEPFYTTKDVGQGTGLGLSITKGILDEHKASIAVVPNGNHTRFEIRFAKATVTA